MLNVPKIVEKLFPWKTSAGALAKMAVTPYPIKPCIMTIPHRMNEEVFELIRNKAA